MASTTTYDARIAVWVTPHTGAIVKYGFLTNVSAAIRADCGHNLVEGTTPTALVYGANAPTPGRASKRSVTGTKSTYYSIEKRDVLKAAKYSLTRPTIRRGASSDDSVALYVTMNGYKYAWRKPTWSFNRITSEASALGIQVATSADNDLVWGSKPLPPRAYKTVGDSVISTIVDPSRIDSLPAGWRSTPREQVD